MDGIETFCRGCLTKYDEPNELIQYTEKNRRLFVYSTGLQVKRNDIFTFQLCKECYINMKMTCNFKKQCRASDRKFKNFLALRESSETSDFSVFLKNSDENLRFPFINEYSTPQQNFRDEDNESTTTSIRNFMSDMLEPEDIPDTEARIIREVIEEDADILDDSLDSHWLQEDISIDTDFQLDFSLSPFASPRPKNDNTNITPKKTSFKVETIKSIEKNKKLILNNQFEEINTTPERDIQDLLVTIPEEDSMQKIPELDDQDDINDKINEYIENSVKTFTENNGRNNNKSTFTKDFEMLVQKTVKDTDDENKLNTDIRDTIDKNLERALKDNTAKVFSLDELIVSPAAYRPSPSPSIKNILFGDSFDLDTVANQPKGSIGKNIERYENVQGEMDLTDFFKDKDETTSFKLNFYMNNDEKVENTEVQIASKKEVVHESEDESESGDEVGKKPKFYCGLCKLEYKNFRGLKYHFTRCHNIKIIEEGYKKPVPKCFVCATCGINMNDASNFNKHVKKHENSKPLDKFQCDICKRFFTSKQRIEMHMRLHMRKEDKKISTAITKEREKFLCKFCGQCSTSRSNLLLHQRRHQKNYTCHCPECGLGFYRKGDLRTHMNKHTQEKPFVCTFCDAKFKRMDIMNLHIKRVHTAEKPYKCVYCKVSFVTAAMVTLHMKRSKKCFRIRNKLQNQEKVHDYDLYLQNNHPSAVT